MLDAAKTVWDVAKDIFELRSKMRDAKRDRQDRLATYLDGLAELMERVAATLELGKYPHGTCAQLEAAALLMEETLNGLIPASKARELQGKLLEVSQIEVLFSHLKNAPDPLVRAGLNELHQAAGYFRATAAHLRVV